VHIVWSVACHVSHIMSRATSRVVSRSDYRCFFLHEFCDLLSVVDVQNVKFSRSAIYFVD
jgi:hypothetical protein